MKYRLQLVLLMVAALIGVYAVARAADVGANGGPKPTSTTTTSSTTSSSKSPSKSPSKSATPSPSKPPPAAKTTLWQGWGAGFVNLVDANPSGSVVLMGGDVAGIWRSTDKGESWTPAQPAMKSDKDKHVAAFFWADDKTVLAYVSTTRGSPETTVWGSHDAAQTWFQILRTNQFAATADNDKGDHPRETGRLLGYNGTNVFIAAADGVYRTEAGGHGAKITKIALSGQNITALAPDPTNPNTLYATADQKGATARGGFYVIKNANASTVNVTHLASFQQAQDVDPVVVGGKLEVWIAAADDGVFRYTPANGQFVDKSDPWFHKAGMVAKTVDTRDAKTIVAGFVFDGAGDLRINGGVPAIWATTDAAAHWRSLVTKPSESAPDPVKDTLPNGERWWLSESDQQFFLNQGNTDISDLEYLGDGKTVLAAGRSDVWRSTDLGKTWNPTIGYVGYDVWQVTIKGDVLLTTSTDWSVVRGTTGTAQPLLEGAKSPYNGGYAVTLAPDDTIYYAGEGYVFSANTTNLHSSTPQKYTNLNFPSDPRVWSLEVSDYQGTRTVVASTDKGVYRKTGKSPGGWTKVLATPGGHTFLSRKPGTDSLMVTSGGKVWTSTNFGSSWTSKTSSAVGPTGDNTGYPLWTTDGRLLLSTKNGVYDATTKKLLWSGFAGPLAQYPGTNNFVVWSGGQNTGGIKVVNPSGSVVTSYTDSILKPLGPFGLCLTIDNGIAYFGSQQFGLYKIPLPAL